MSIGDESGVHKPEVRLTNRTSSNINNYLQVLYKSEELYRYQVEI